MLVLGSMPSVLSLRAGEYYANPRNAFWPVIGELLGWRSRLAYEDRASRLREARIALWDVLQSGEREGSLDSSIVAGSETPNDFNAFLRAHARRAHRLLQRREGRAAVRRASCGRYLPTTSRRSLRFVTTALDEPGSTHRSASETSSRRGERRSPRPSRRTQATSHRLQAPIAMRALLGNGNVLLAPMAGITEAPFRGICKRMGAGLTYTEMVSAKGLHYNPDSRISKALSTFSPEEVPCAVQIFGAEPEMMAEQAARNRSEARRRGRRDRHQHGLSGHEGGRQGRGQRAHAHAGACRADRAGRRVGGACPGDGEVPKGWDATESVNAVEFARWMEASGAAALAVHGRTPQPVLPRKADWDSIATVKQAVNVPVVGSGDVFSAADAKRDARATGVDAVMVARGAQGNPWIFREARALIDDGLEIEPPTPFERIDMAREHAAALVELGGERAFTRMRKHVAWYISGMPGAVARPEPGEPRPQLLRARRAARRVPRLPRGTPTAVAD